jgi:hypothetical protein
MTALVRSRNAPSGYNSPNAVAGDFAGRGKKTGGTRFGPRGQAKGCD